MTAVLVALLLFGAALETASAQAPYPNRPIRIVVPFGPGGFADITMRLAGQDLSERTGQQVVIENRPSAGGIVAANAVTAAQPDGYTLFVMSSGIALSKSLLKTMPFDPETAFAPISTVAMFDNTDPGAGRFAAANDAGHARRSPAPIRVHSTSGPSIPAARRMSPPN